MGRLDTLPSSLLQAAGGACRSVNYNLKPCAHWQLQSPNSATNCRRLPAEIGHYSRQCGQGFIGALSTTKLYFRVGAPAVVFTARCYAERGYEIACRLSLRLSVTIGYTYRIGWNSSKIISRPDSLRLLRSLPQHGRSGATGTPPKLGWNMGGVRST